MLASSTITIRVRAGNGTMIDRVPDQRKLLRDVQTPTDLCICVYDRYSDSGEVDVFADLNSEY